MLNSITATSAIDNQLQQAAEHSVEGDANITIKEITDFSLIQLAAWADTISQTEAIAAQVANATTAPGYGQATVGYQASLLRIEPLKYWVLCTNDSEDENQSTESLLKDLTELDAETACVLDLSHSRTWLRINGIYAQSLLNHFLPIDLRDDHFKINTVATTAFHHVGVTLWLSETGFELLLPRSFAASLTEILTASARQYGFRIISS